jgi:chaperonin cofactor prefoldin
MPKGQRRTLEQQLDDLKKKQAEIEARIKAKSALSADHKAVKAIIADIEKVADDAGVLAKDVVKLITSKISPRKTRTPSAQ